MHESYNSTHFDEVKRKIQSIKPDISPILPQCRAEAVSLIAELPTQPGSKWESRITMEELEHSIRYSNSRSAPGEDSITYSMLKLCGEKFKKVLLNLFNYC
jgi:hypothetical protein